MKNVGVFGIGAIGALLTKYIIADKINKYFFFNRSQKDEINIIFNGKEDTVKINLSPIENHNLDWLIVCLKEYHVKGALSDLAVLINENTKVAVFQNGINLSSAYRAATRVEYILESIIDCPIQRIDTNQLLQIRKPIITLPKNRIAQEFIELFESTEINFKTTQKFVEAQWTKLIESSAIGSIQSYTEKTCIIFKENKFLKEYKALVNEGIGVAKSAGIKVEADLSQQLLKKLQNYPEIKGSSMLADKLAGNKLELDAKIGAIVKMADKNGIDIPTTRRIYDLLIKER